MFAALIRGDSDVHVHVPTPVSCSSGERAGILRDARASRRAPHLTMTSSPWTGSVMGPRQTGNRAFPDRPQQGHAACFGATTGSAHHVTWHGAAGLGYIVSNSSGARAPFGRNEPPRTRVIRRRRVISWQKGRTARRRTARRVTSCWRRGQTATAALERVRMKCAAELQQQVHAVICDVRCVIRRGRRTWKLEVQQPDLATREA